MRSYEELIFLAAAGKLPEDTDEWEIRLRNKDFWTVAHEAAANCCLPKRYERLYELADWKGWSVAHVMAWPGATKLPEGFDQWALSDNWGHTVAHEVAQYGRFPEGFNQWGLKDNHGWSVAHELAWRLGIGGEAAPEAGWWERWGNERTFFGESVRETFEKARKRKEGRGPTWKL
jgi:hypothetical protein